MLVPRRSGLDPLFEGMPKLPEADFARFRGDVAPERRIDFCPVPLHFGACTAGAYVLAHPLTFGRAQFTVEPGFNKRPDLLTVGHKNDLSLSCNFLRA